ncbi:MAG: phosphatidylglycerol lysyltransferase domain-containing protein [Geobacteraceae bacterium]|nr:phosphatidylglycerol lysyltransferase domain-containing protein [Geobacteraceae bacterium]
MDIPVWPASRPLDIRDKPDFDNIFEQMQPRASELTFAGLYLFRTAHEYCLSLAGDSIVVRGKGYDGTCYCLPPLGGDVAGACDLLLDAGLKLYGVEEAFAAQLQQNVTFELVENRESFDYLYLREEMATLPGNRFHKKKNRINYFTSRHSYEVQIYSAQYLCGCLQLLDEWGRVAEVEGNRSFGMEMDAAAEALSRAGALGLKGIVVVVGGVVRAFALGELLNRETAVCHFEKADHFMEGLSQLVNREFARLLFTDRRYINREQDLGEPGLRIAKLSYHPVELVKKFWVRRKQ